VGHTEEVKILDLNFSTAPQFLFVLTIQIKIMKSCSRSGPNEGSNENLPYRKRLLLKSETRHPISLT
jgi:hypothetical protein